MRARVTHALRTLHAMAVENSVQPGTPDVEYIGGWIELKSLDAWPKRADTAVAVSHFNQFQRLWLRRRSKMGGRAHLVLRVGTEWLVLEGGVAADIVGVATKGELLASAVFHWEKTPSEEQLLAAFRDGKS